jgi:hypothetical protein
VLPLALALEAEMLGMATEFLGTLAPKMGEASTVCAAAASFCFVC